ncbi:hypothetical protein TGCAST_389740 [Toxoplasma gondii CAST]|uniref:Uncharacterized protein n=1 Tax=Toxoplasma gondii CAST TaxID=943122 RepID=A0A3R8BMT2_TOXGO|nr:hypothetical protein TGCAST_389740 [Toxoplasma gondii CAST]
MSGCLRSKAAALETVIGSTRLCHDFPTKLSPSVLVEALKEAMDKLVEELEYTGNSVVRGAKFTDVFVAVTGHVDAGGHGEEEEVDAEKLTNPTQSLLQTKTQITGPGKEVFETSDGSAAASAQLADINNMCEKIALI